MSENIDITKYFSENKNGKVEEFFDQIKDMSESNDSLSSLEAKSQSGREEETSVTENEPVVCKLFQKIEPKKIRDNDSTNFFDVISDTAGSNISPFGPPSKLISTEGILDALPNFEESIPSTGNITEYERSRDAWIPPDQTRRQLIEMVTSPPGSYVPKKEYLTMPGVILEEDLKDPVYEAVQHYLGPGEAARRKVLTSSEVTQDDRGIRDLIQAGCYSAAVNLTKTLLTIYGQGAGRAGHPSKHTVHSIQLWFTRLALLIKLRSFRVAHVEAEPFGDLDKPDMFFQFYPELYGGRTGSMVPFSLRLLVAQLPAYVEKHQLALTKLYSLLANIRKMLSNLEKELLEDGGPCVLSESVRKESIKFWTQRETRVLHYVVNTALMYKDFSIAIEVMQTLIEKEEDQNKVRALQSALGRILLQLGDLTFAEKLFSTAQLGLDTIGPRDYIDSGLLLLTQSNFQEAYHMFEKAYKLQPQSITAINNMSVCLLYLGRLKDSVLLLEEALQRYPTLAVHESLILNLCTLYELQSSVCSQPKMKLLSLVSQYKGDGMNVGCIKLQM
ncbi:hypothetical protein RUM44_011429 [Polyplax serrata]|uniref:Trafficking protein particle complex subunit 12 n=1 Tax=Polyplax serrata TaxID=468196 RepID=A0ABR1AQ16_POLSC